ncbi:glycoside hydrolase family 25 protein [Ferruginibacter albus]|uniref:glycoside hydrolase family 25 protein n=1 Tax=Ferruginibacter albus TaxID=2875540 RepID=UPI001CC5B1E3|nr:GH25 family lysozyme [Ferruginibacter albus]UAY51953.1 glycoside hydrolase family 25 protein [Ferruginibacter albus]
MLNNYKKPANIYVLTFLMLAAISMTVFYFSNAPYQHKKYKGFGIRMPKKYLIHGIDVSHHQASINWEDVSQMEYNNIRLQFSFIKATEGTDRVDKNFFSNWNEARDAGLVVGAYHYFNAGLNPRLQAQNFIAIVNLKTNDLPPVLDIEDIGESSSKQLIKDLKEWLTTVDSAYHIKPIIYSNVNFYEQYLAGNFDDYPVWIANYVDADKPGTDNKWILWQHSQTGHVNGIDGNVDFNVFNGDSTAFNSLLIK